MISQLPTNLGDLVDGLVEETERDYELAEQRLADAAHVLTAAKQNRRNAQALRRQYHITTGQSAADDLDLHIMTPVERT